MWITPTIENVKAGITGPEVTAYKTAALAASQADPSIQIMAGVVSEIRSYVGSNRFYRLGTDGTIPDETLDDFVRLCAKRLMVRVGLGENEKLVSMRNSAAKDALDHLRAIAKGELDIVPATTFSDTQMGTTYVQEVRAGCNLATPSKTRGLI